MGAPDDSVEISKYRLDGLGSGQPHVTRTKLLRYLNESIKIKTKSSLHLATHEFCVDKAPELSYGVLETRKHLPGLWPSKMM